MKIVKLFASSTTYGKFYKFMVIYNEKRDFMEKIKVPRPFSLLIKPASYGCNLRCKYCFYLKKKELFGSNHMMSDDVLKKMISSFLCLDMPSYSFGWQGGEPTLMGLDFFRQVVKYQQQFAAPDSVISNGLQTNGTLLDDEWCEHLAKYKFLVGISVDGPEEIHDLNRLTVSAEGSHRLVMRGIEALKRHKVEYNVLTLVSSANVKQPLLIYNYLKEHGVYYHQYIECIEFDSNDQLTGFSVTPEQWGEFLCSVFDEWYKKDVFTVSVRLFDSILTRLVDGYANACAFGTDCRQYLVVENNGNIYPCDFFVTPELKLGNLMNDSWLEMLNSPVYEAFGKRKSNWNDECVKCEYLKICSGCCPKNRPTRGEDPTRLSILCDGWKMFYNHTMSRFKEIANRIIKDRKAAEEQERLEKGRYLAAMRASGQVKKVGRNDPCPCGSGKKFKKCCG
jgi:uncharacterized protein